MTVSIVVPVWNEGEQLASNLAKLVETVRADSLHRFEIVVVDDGSTDGTLREALAFAAAHEDVRVIVHPSNRGIAAAIATGAANARGKVVVVVDADLSYDPSHVVRMVDVYVRTGAPIIVASPYMRGGSVEGVPFERRILSRAANKALALADRHRSQTYTGMVRAYDRTTLLQLLVDGGGPLTNERILLEARRRRLPVVEVAAALRWAAARGRGRLSPHRIVNRIFAVVACGAAFAVTP